MRLLISVLVLTRLAAEPVTFERIRHADREPWNWLTYSGGYAGHRHSGLSQVTRANVGRLRPAWVYQIESSHPFETSPLVIDGVMYLSEPTCTVTALDAKTGGRLWRYDCKLPARVSPCCSLVNRGLAVLGDSLFFGTFDGRLIALDIKTGAARWMAQVADYKAGYAITSAPLAVNGKIVVGIAGGETGVRGFLDAYAPEDGKRVWRFWTVPGPGSPGHETWSGDSWKTGGAPTWVTGSYDADLDLIFWGTGNPAPPWNGANRLGDNLYSNSLLALEASTGRLRWYFQFTPHDEHDWDSTQVPVLVDGIFAGRPRRMVLIANRNAFYYVLDRATGEFLLGKPFARQTWASGLDAKGRPIQTSNSLPSVEGTTIYPGVLGATNWYSPSFSYETGLLYVATSDGGSIYHRAEPSFDRLGAFLAGSIRGIYGEPVTGATRALDRASGQVRWEIKMFSPPQGGLLSTAGDLVFGSTGEGYFVALDARTGRPLWRLQTGATIRANPVAYMAGGKQHVSIAAGRALFSFALD